MTVEVRKEEIRGLLDGKVIATHKMEGSKLSVVDLWALPQTDRLGVGAWNSSTTFHAIEFRGALKSETAATLNRNATMPAKPEPNKDTVKVDVSKGKLAGKNVLIVIANQDFFYREYADPRHELEEAGAKVTVAAGRKAACQPHTNSGEGRDGGVVTADIALADVKSTDYDAVLFSGGWGASSYQFAFEGRYNEASYNGDKNIKSAANRVIKTS